jgi:cellulose synthase (UDP-forming)
MAFGTLLARALRYIVSDWKQSMSIRSISLATKKWLDDVRGKKFYKRYFEMEDRKRRTTTQLFSLLAVVSNLVYLIWVFHKLNLSFWWLSIPFFLAEIAGLFIFMSFCIISWYPRYHNPTGLPPKDIYSVDIFITACGEPYEIVYETTKAAEAIDYPQKKIYLLDDSGQADLEKLSKDIGAGYFARKVHADAKAGNLNYALQRTNGELVLTLDADQVPAKDILKRTIGYFNFSHVGFVQTKQSFKVPEGDPFCNSDSVFYNVMQPGKDSDNAAFSCGSGVVYRRKALEEIGGFSTWNLVEDLHTSMLLHANGWRSVYHNYPLTQGTAPTDIWGVYKQRTQWTADSLRIFFWDNPFKKKGLSLKQKFHYAHIGLVYLFAGFIMPFFYVLPILSLYTGQLVIHTEFWRYLVYRMPSLFCTAFTYKMAATPTSKMAATPTSYHRAINTWLGYFPCFIYGTLKALSNRKRKPPYRVNRKTSRPINGISTLTGILPQSLIVTLSIVSIPYAFIQQTGNLDLLLISSLWALLNVEKLHWICWAPFSIKLFRMYKLETAKGLSGREQMARPAQPR